MTPKENLKALKLELRQCSLERQAEYKDDDEIIKGVLEIDKKLNEKYLSVEQAPNELEALKKPPTVDEVCKTIQDELSSGKVEYIEGNKEFMFVNHGEKMNITDVYGNTYKIIGYYKSSTITLIGRFYEGLEVKE